jgi:hypothetical protein
MSQSRRVRVSDDDVSNDDPSSGAIDRRPFLITNTFTLRFLRVRGKLAYRRRNPAGRQWNHSWVTIR